MKQFPGLKDASSAAAADAVEDIADGGGELLVGEGPKDILKDATAGCLPLSGLLLAEKCSSKCLDLVICVSGGFVYSLYGVL